MSGTDQSCVTPDPTAPRKMTADDQSVEAHSLRDQLDAADRRDANAVAAKRRLGIRFSRIRPGDAV